MKNGILVEKGPNGGWDVMEYSGGVLVNRFGNFEKRDQAREHQRSMKSKANAPAAQVAQ